jgi:hypothetical protein
MTDPVSPICSNCDYDLRTQVELQHPGYIADGSPIEIRCDDCGHTFVWPRVTPDKAPRMTGINSNDIRTFLFISAIATLLLVLSFVILELTN